MEKKIATVSGSVEFRDVVMDLDRQRKYVYVRLHGTDTPTYEILPRHVDPFQRITIDGLFKNFWPPVYMEDFAQALLAAADQKLRIDIFTLEVP